MNYSSDSFASKFLPILHQIIMPVFGVGCHCLVFMWGFHTERFICAFTSDFGTLFSHVLVQNKYHKTYIFGINLIQKEINIL